MVRTQIQLTEKQAKRVRQIAGCTGDVREDVLGTYVRKLLHGNL